MVYYIKGILAAVLMIFTLQVSQAVDLPTTTVAGEPCYYYDVQPKETIYSVAEKLGITRSVIVKYNPSVADGLRPGSRLYLPVSVFGEKSTAAVDDSRHEAATRPADVAEEQQDEGTDTDETEAEGGNDNREDSGDEVDGDMTDTVTHVVRRGESIYGISRKYGVPMERIIAFNPSAENGVRNGDRLVIPLTASAKAPAGTADEMPPAREGYYIYRIQPGETLSYIAADNNVSVDGLMADNPQLEGLTDYTGVYIYIPITRSLIGSERRISETAVVHDDGNADEADSLMREPLKIAVVLPFMLSEDEPSKTAQLFTEFYKGLMLAADSLKTPGNRPVTIYAYDSAASVDTVMKIIQRPEFETMNFVIAPDNEEQIQAIASGVGSQTYVLNLFNARNELQNTRSNVIQANIPHASMYDKAIDALRERYPGHRPIFLSRIDGSADKDAFITRFKARLDADTCGYRDIAYRNLLSDDDLKVLPVDSDYIFIPVSGTRSEFAKITGALKRFRDNPEARSVVLFGYPEWITFRGDYQNRLGELNVTIYTRFYADMGDDAVADFTRRYKDTYNETMLDAVPNQGLLGFDTGMYVISALRANGGNFHAGGNEHKGLQSDFELVDDGQPGLVNGSLLFVTFGDNGFITKVNL